MNIMAEGRAYFQIKPSLIFWPGLLLCSSQFDPDCVKTRMLRFEAQPAGS
jgi:hypothetical protein